MTKRMLIDAAHPEETRVVVMDGHRVEEFDLEAANRLPLKGNIYLARIVRVEPSLQAAFVEYGGNRHGFLAFGEIHPDYYQIPAADRRALLEAQAREAREEAEAEAREDDRRAQAAARRERGRSAPRPAEDEAAAPTRRPRGRRSPGQRRRGRRRGAEPRRAAAPTDEAPPETVGEAREGLELLPEDDAAPAEGESAPEPNDADIAENEEERARKRETPRFLRNYKIQEVIKRRQVMLIQVVKEERGTKGAALTTYISLAGRFSVLMPNSPRGGGVSARSPRPATAAACAR
jgi:ribonuclease E